MRESPLPPSHRRFEINAKRRGFPLPRSPPFQHHERRSLPLPSFPAVSIRRRFDTRTEGLGSLLRSFTFQRQERIGPSLLNSTPDVNIDIETDAETDPNRSMSDDDLEDVTLAIPARALYPFQAKAEFRELTVGAGDELDIIKEDDGKGWSLHRGRLAFCLKPIIRYVISPLRDEFPRES